jgi:hypothetical protein
VCLQDPEERINLADDPAYADQLAFMKKKLESYLGNFPLVHTPLDEELERGIDAKDGVVVTCWCRPPGLAHLDYLCDQ